jgi:hypothetical protein
MIQEEFKVIPFPNSTRHGSGNGGGDDMNSRVTRVETIIESQKQLIIDIHEDIRGIRADIQQFDKNTTGELRNVERRLVDKAEENHKWVIALIISSILVPILLSLVTK